MLSSNSGFQRLSQAALSRSRFLRLAAGALLPFVGWRLSAAAAPNPELAQNSGAPGTKDAAAPGRMGAILVSQFGPVKIHSYLSPADGLQVNTQMIEGPNAVVIFDGQLLLPYADEVASYVQTLGKPVDRIILSHAHTDHWGGLQVLTERFPDARVFALDGIADQVRARGPARLDGLRRTYGDKAATKVTVPTETITEGLQRIDGVTYDFKRFVDAESDLQLAALLPEQKVLMAFDLVFSPNQHAFTGANHFDHWMIVLELLKALQGYDTIIIGHDTPGRPLRDRQHDDLRQARQGDPCGFRRRENLQREPKSRFPRSAAGRLCRFVRQLPLRRAPLSGASQRCARPYRSFGDRDWFTLHADLRSAVPIWTKMPTAWQIISQLGLPLATNESTSWATSSLQFRTTAASRRKKAVTSS